MSSSGKTETTTTIDRSNSLADLAARIKAEHEASVASIQRGAEHAMRAGDLLIEAKAQVRHGEWLPWLNEHCAISERTAQLYMRLAKARAEVEANPQHVADMSLRGAMAVIAPSPDEKALAEGKALAGRLGESERHLADVIAERFVKQQAFAKWFYDQSFEDRRTILKVTGFTRHKIDLWLNRDVAFEARNDARSMMFW